MSTCKHEAGSKNAQVAENANNAHAHTKASLLLLLWVTSEKSVVTITANHNASGLLSQQMLGQNNIPLCYIKCVCSMYYTKCPYFVE